MPEIFLSFWGIEKCVVGIVLTNMTSCAVICHSLRLRLVPHTIKGAMHFTQCSFTRNVTQGLTTRLHAAINLVKLFVDFIELAVKGQQRFDVAREVDFQVGVGDFGEVFAVVGVGGVTSDGVAGLAITVRGMRN